MVPVILMTATQPKIMQFADQLKDDIEYASTKHRIIT